MKDNQAPCPDNQPGCVIRHSRPHGASRLTWAQRILNGPFQLMEEILKKYDITKLERVQRMRCVSWYLEVDGGTDEDGEPPKGRRFGSNGLLAVVDAAYRALIMGEDVPEEHKNHEGR